MGGSKYRYITLFQKLFMKIYLDTNTIIDLFINHAKSLKNIEEFRISEKYRFFISKKEQVEFILSILTKAEIVRELVSGFNLSKDEIETLWQDFVNSLNCKMILEFVIDSRLVDIVYSVPIKLRTLINFQHIFIAIEEDAYLLSGDKDLITKTRQLKVYDKIFSYLELRKLLG